MRERASGGRAAIFLSGEAREEFASSETASEFQIQLDSSPILSRLRHSRSRLRYQNKSTHAPNPASYAGYVRSSLKVPASATPNEVDRESVQKKVCEWVVTSSQESRNPFSLGNCCSSSGEEFYSTKNKQIEVGKAMRSSSKQNKSIKP